MDNISNSFRKQHKPMEYFTNLWPLWRYLWHKIWMHKDVYFYIYLIYLSNIGNPKKIAFPIQVPDHNFIYKLLFLLLVASLKISKGIEPWMSSPQVKYLSKHFLFSAFFPWMFFFISYRYLWLFSFL